MSPGDGSILVRDLGGVSDPGVVIDGRRGADPAVVIDALSRGAAVPIPIAGRYTSLQAVNTAITTGTRAVLTPFTG